MLSHVDNRVGLTTLIEKPLISSVKLQIFQQKHEIQKSKASLESGTG